MSDELRERIAASVFYAKRGGCPEITARVWSGLADEKKDDFRLYADTIIAMLPDSAEAERRGELKGLEWCLESYETCSYGAASRYDSVLRARIAELKKGAS
jgi:hypothetical protein